MIGGQGSDKMDKLIKFNDKMLTAATQIWELQNCRSHDKSSFIVLSNAVIVELYSKWRHFNYSMHVAVCV